MPNPHALTQSGRIYVTGVVLAGVVAVLHSVLTLIQQPVPWQWAMLALLTLLSGSFTVRIPGVSARLSVSDTFVFAAVLLFGPAAATMTVVLDTLVISFWLGRASTPLPRLLFNVAAPAVAIWAASHVFYLFGGIEALSIAPRPVLSVVLPLFGLAALYFLINSWLVAFAVAFQKQQSAAKIWRDNFLWLSLNYFSGASVAALLLPYLLQANTYDSFLYVTGALLPVLLIFYLTFKAALGRVDDANRHLSELNRLYLSTIETLAMAIDAKDQITHGHIRRVQQYAVRLAEQMGVNDSAQIRAIEAASLLHDMGKLAVPEYILNKPGKLTPAEFEKMKLHASVGADILSAIDFPYPVVPIVRHHHENWDGTGYPDGLSGTEIPVGARILAVVDCFDALTSDRPYRPRLGDSEALKILIDRRGSMYDPLVVDAFIQVHSESSEAEGGSNSESKAGLFAIARGLAAVEHEDRASRLGQIAASTEEMLVLYDLAIALPGNIGFRETCDIVAAHLRRLVPAIAYVFYVYEQASDDLVAAHATGENASHFSGLRIHRGQRLTGWVAANKQTIVNSDPVLDLGEIARVARPRLTSCLSTPLLSGAELIGVLTLYSANEDGFTEDHRRIIEVIASQTAVPIKRALTVDGRSRTKEETNPINAIDIDDVAVAEVMSVGAVSVIVITISYINRSDGIVTRPASIALEFIVEGIRKSLRVGDLFLRYKVDQFLVLLPETDSTGANLIASRISERLIEECSKRPESRALDPKLGIASTPRDGLSVEALIETAHERERRVLEPPPRASIH
jgi:putative nucleotidyltransferase with HDIG domain